MSMILAAMLSCGVERWSAKTLSDGTHLAFKPVSTTISALVQSPRQNHARYDARGSGVESTLYRVDALLLGFKQEGDGDFHIVIGDGVRTMIVEIPDAACVANRDPSIHAKMVAARSFVERFGVASDRMYWLAKPVRVRVTGFGFFDFLHGQTGVAPNGVELHPALRIELAP